MAGMMEETPFKYVVVSAAYRVNAFGFLSSEELQAEAESNGHSAGNMGFWDQRAALEWTAANIECFGGDPKKITVAGYSAGEQRKSSECHRR
jgi:carboxylesterase type B